MTGARPSPISQGYRVADFFVVRSPLLPVERLLEWHRSDGPREGTERGSDEDRSNLWRRLRREFTDPALLDAVFFASPELWDVLARDRGEVEVSPKLQRSLLRYFLRATGRETPFGLFAGNSVGRVGEEDRFELQSRHEYRSHTTVSISYLSRLLSQLSNLPEVRDAVAYEPNSTLSVTPVHYRIAVDSRELLAGRVRSSSTVVEVTRTPQIDRVLELSRGGRSLADIAEALLEPGVELPELLEFCRKLCEAKILVPTLLPPATGCDSVQTSIERLHEHPELGAARALLVDADAALRATDEGRLGASGPRFAVLRSRLLEWESPVVTVQPLQTELVKPVSRLTISETLAGRLLAAAELVQRVARPQTDPELAEFRERFAARYDRRLVPIAEALDIDSGVGFGGGESHVSEALTEGLPFGPAREQEPLTDSIDRVRIRLFERALSQRSAVVELDEDLLDMLPQSELREPTCESFALVVRLARAHDGRTLVVVPELASPSALPLFGRFCEADAELHQAASAYAELEQRLAGETVLADVVYLPSDEAANVVKRPLLRKYEIPCGGRSGTAPDRQLPISDLLVGVEGQHVELYSRRLKSRVAVRFATAHNYDQTTLPTLYRFLGALQHQDGCRLSSGWTWGALEGSAFLPRVVCGDTILCLARWEISAREWAPLLAAEPENLLDRARELRVARGLPRWLTRSEFDRRLTVDFENQLSLEELVHDARKQPRIALEELVPTSEQLVLHGPEGSYAAQFVVPFVRRAPLARRPVPSELLGSSVRPTRRCRIPGSDWLYARIYAGKSQHAALLRCLQDGVVEPSLGSDATLWFYLPFADPESHLRVRFQGEPARLTSSVLSRLERALEPLLESGAVSRLELGSYEPELERYGGPTGVQLAERVFFADSDASSQLVALAADDHDLRWRLALVGIDRLLSDCGAGLEQRAGLARRASAAYGDEMGATTATWKVVGERYRNCAPVLSRWLWDSPGTDVILKKTRRILAARSARIESIWKEIERATLDGSMRLPDDEELPLTLAHLHALRVLGAGSRAREMVLYEFLKRQYAAQRSTGGAKYELRSD